MLRSWVRAWHRMKALDSCCRRVVRVSGAGELGSPSRCTLARGSVPCRSWRRREQNHKVAGVESTLARLESARSLDSLILHMQEKVGPSPLARWPQDVRPGRPLDGSGGTGLLDSDLRRDALFGDSAGFPRELGAFGALKSICIVFINWNSYAVTNDCI